MRLTFKQRIRAFLLGTVDLPAPIASLPTPPRRVVVGSYNGMTLATWQSSGDHIKWMQSMMNNDKFRDMLAVLSNMSVIVDAKTLDGHHAAFDLGKLKGIETALQVLLMLARFPVQEQAEVDADYGASEKEWAAADVGLNDEVSL